MTEYTTPHRLPKPEASDRIASPQENLRTAIGGLADAVERELSLLPPQSSLYQNVAVGEGALGAVENLRARNNNAFGIGALAHAHRARYNDAFGLNALYYLDSGIHEPDTTKKATRNSAFGSNAQRFNKTGYNNVTMGRNSLQNNTTGHSNVVLGAGAVAGYAPVGLSGEIENQIPTDISETVAVGTSALSRVLAGGNVAVGYGAGQRMSLASENVAVGHEALRALDTLLGPDGRPQTTVNWTVQYAIGNGQLTVTHAGHGLQPGDMVRIEIPGREYQQLVVASATADSIVLQADLAGVADESGTATVVYYTTSAPAPDHSSNVALGARALGNLEGLLDQPRPATENVALGTDALTVMQDGTDATHLTNTVGIGHAAAVSGDDQVQIGTNGMDVYTGGAVQQRSDARDKTDVRDTRLGLTFIEALRPVDYRWDRRSDYQDRDGDGHVTVQEPDGSRAGTRFHHGLIAQEVQAVIDDLGIDFGGFQDHKVNGGSDVLSIGYTELLGPLIRAVQELSARVRELEGRFPA